MEGVEDAVARVRGAAGSDSGVGRAGKDARMLGAARKVKLRRAMIGTRSAVPRYTREFMASMRERKHRHGPVQPEVDLAELRGARLGAFWIGHATVLLRVGGLNILTDPVFSRRVGMTLGGVTLGVARLKPPAVDVDHLPPIDLVLLSHAHFDHLDRPSLKRLALGPGLGATVLTATNTKRLVPPGFGDVIEVPWKRSVRIAGVTVSAVRPEHWGARTAVDRHRRFNSYLLECSHDRVLFAGDTAHTHAFDQIGAVDLSVFGIGAYDPWEGHHATPEQVWSMYTRLSGGRPQGWLLPMHHSTFALGREPLHEPMQRLKRVACPHEHHIVAETPGSMWVLGQNGSGVSVKKEC